MARNTHKLLSSKNLRQRDVGLCSSKIAILGDGKIGYNSSPTHKPPSTRASTRVSTRGPDKTTHIERIE